jgi:hypothetical protein
MLQHLKDTAASRLAGNNQRLIPRLALKNILTTVQTNAVLLLCRSVTFNAAIQQQRTNRFLESFFTIRPGKISCTADNNSNQQPATKKMANSQVEAVKWKMRIEAAHVDNQERRTQFSVFGGQQSAVSDQQSVISRASRCEPIADA